MPAYTPEELDTLNQVIPDLTAHKGSLKMMHTVNGKGVIDDVQYTNDAEPLSIPQNLNWQSLPQGWEALRYAQAVAPRPPSLAPPNISVLRDDNLYNAVGVTDPDNIGLTKKSLNASAFPYVIPPSVPEQTVSKFSGVLPHELVHYLILNAAKKAGISSNTYSKQAFDALPPYTPMYGHFAPNQHDNYDEELANRVERPYVDAQIIGQKAAPLLDTANKTPFKNSADASIYSAIS